MTHVIAEIEIRIREMLGGMPDIRTKVGDKIRFFGDQNQRIRQNGLGVGGVILIIEMVAVDPRTTTGISMEAITENTKRIPSRHGILVSY